MPATTTYVKHVKRVRANDPRERFHPPSGVHQGDVDDPEEEGYGEAAESPEEQNLREHSGNPGEQQEPPPQKPINLPGVVHTIGSARNPDIPHAQAEQLQANEDGKVAANPIADEPFNLIEEAPEGGRTGEIYERRPYVAYNPFASLSFRYREPVKQLPRRYAYSVSTKAMQQFMH